MKFSSPIPNFTTDKFPKGDVIQIRNLSYFDFHPITAPFLGKLLLGIKKVLTNLFFIKAKQRKKSIGFSLLRLKIQTPNCFELTGLSRLNFLLYKLQTLTSTNLLSQSKSGPLLNFKCFAFNNFAPYFSHLNPKPVAVFLKSEFFIQWLLVKGLYLKYEVLLIHLIEQYLRILRGCYKSFGTILLHNLHLFIYKYYQKDIIMSTI